MADIVGAYQNSCGCSGADEIAGGSASDAKLQLVRKIAKDIAAATKVKIDVSGDLQSIVAQMKANIPDPRKAEKGGNHKVVRGNMAQYEALCKKVARILNEAFGVVVIRENLPAKEICDQVAEQMDALAVELSAEFSTVRTDTERILKNIHVLESMHDKVFANITKTMAESDAAESNNVTILTQSLRDTHQALHQEISRQIKLLEHMLNIVIHGNPSDREVEKALRSSGALKSMVKKLSGDNLGDFQKKIGYMLAGTNNTMFTLAQVDKALEAVGISKKDLDKIRNPGELRDAISKSIEKLIESQAKAMADPSVPDQDKAVMNAKLGKMLKMADSVMNLAYLAKEWDHVSAKSTKKTGGAEGGRDQKLDKRIKERQVLKIQLFKQYTLRASTLWHLMQKAAAMFAKAIMNGRVPLSDKLETFNNAVSGMSNMTKELYYATSGLVQDTRATQEREQFIEQLEFVIATIRVLQGETGYKSVDGLNDMKNNLEELVKLSKEICARYQTGFQSIIPPKAPRAAEVVGRDEDEDYHDNVEGGLNETPAVMGQPPTAAAPSKQIAALLSSAGTASACFGMDIARSALKCGGDGPTHNEDYNALEMPAMNRVAEDLTQTKQLIDYAFKRRRIMDNLVNASKEIEHYREDYDKQTGDAIADSIDTVRQELRQYGDKNIKGAPAPVAGAPPALYAALLAQTGTPELGPAQKKQFDTNMMARKRQSEAKIALYRTAEAMDMFMANFSAASSADPNADTIRKLLDSLGEFNTFWFSSATGNLICDVFDAMPAALVAGAAAVSRKPVKAIPPTSPLHYYQFVRDSMLDRAAAGLVPIQPGSIGLPGNPFAAQTIDKYEGHLKLVAEATSKMTALKNLLATFVNLASDFGGRKISDKVPMTPIEIYKNLMMYMQQSSFSIGYADRIGQNGSVAVTTRDYESIAVRCATYPDDQHVVIGAASADPLDAHLTYIMRPAGLADSTGAAVANPYDDVFAQTDKLFVHIIKAVVAKMFVAMGMHAVLNHPVSRDGLGFYGPLRTIMGGGVESTTALTGNRPKIVVAANELYIRLVPAAEGFRKLFAFDSPVAAGASTITMIPEVDGVFSPLINFVFDRNASVIDGRYSETEKDILIGYCNEIYARFSKHPDPITKAIDAFYDEMNQRYGVVSDADRTAYINARNSRYTDEFRGRQDDEMPATDFELDGLDESEVYGRPMPSQQYERTEANFSTALTGQHKHKLDYENNFRMIQDLRKRLAEMFTKTEESLFNADDDTDELSGLLEKRISLRPIVRSSNEELAYAKTEDERRMIVHQTMDQLAQYSLSVRDKSYVAFHELVATPIIALTALYNRCVQYRDEIGRMFNVVEAFSDAEYRAPYAVVPPVLAGLAPGPVLNFVSRMIDDVNPAAAAGNLAAQKLANRQQSFQDIYARRMGAAGWSQANFLALVAEDEISQGASGLSAAAGNNTILAQLVRMSRIANQDDQVEAMKRFLAPQNQMFADIIGLIGQFNGELVTSNISVNRLNGEVCNIAITVNFSKLTELVNVTLEAVKKMYNKFIGLVDEDKIKAWLKVDDDRASANGGTIYNLEKNFQERLIMGHGQDLKGSTLDDTNRRLDKVLQYLTHAWRVGVANTSSGAFAVPNGQYMVLAPLGSAGKQQHSFNAIVSRMIYGSGIAGGVEMSNAGAVAAVAPAAAGGVFTGIFTPLINRTVRPAAAAGAAYVKFPDVENARGAYPVDTLANGSSLIAQFNAIVTALLKISFDEPTNKLFATAISDFASGAFSTNVMGVSAGDSIADGPGATAEAILANVDSPLYKSLAQVLKHLIVDKTVDGNNQLYLEADIANIQSYVKERMRSEFPVIAAMIAALIQRADLLRQFIGGMNMSYTSCVDLTASNVWAPADHAAWVRATEQRVERMSAMLTKISTGLTSLQTCISETLRIVGADAKYFEVVQNFIGDYRAANGTNPLMPISSVLHALYANYDFSPLQSFGSMSQKFHYGTNAVLCGDFKADRVPGVIDIVRQHNHSVDKRHQFADDEVVMSARRVANIVRYMVGVNRYAPWCGATPVADVQYYVPGVEHTVFQMPAGSYTVDQVRASLARVITATESKSQRDQRRAMVHAMNKATDCNCGTRDDVIVFNIIDRNKPPINVHALMRDIPLNELYQFSITFDDFVAHQFGRAAARGPNVPGDVNNARNNREAFSELLRDPYAAISDDTYDRFVAGIMRGDMATAGLAQPKMLGLELYNKALFGEQYAAAVYAEERDTGLGHAHQRGKQEVLAHASANANQDFARTAVLRTLNNVFGVAAAQNNLSVAIANGWSSDAMIGTLMHQKNWTMGGYKGAINMLFDQGSTTSKTLMEAYIRQNLPAAPAAPAQLISAADYAALLSEFGNAGVKRNPGNAAESLAIVNAAAASLPAGAFALNVVAGDIADYAVKYMMNFYNKACLYLQIVHGLGQALNQYLRQPGFDAAANAGTVKALFVSAHNAIMPMISAFIAGGGGGAGAAFVAAVAADPDCKKLGFKLDGIGMYRFTANPNAVDLVAADLAPIAPALMNNVPAHQPTREWPELARTDRRRLGQQNGRYFPRTLSYMKSRRGALNPDAPKGNMSELENIVVGDQKETLQMLGKLRFDTKFCRDLFWISNLQRLMIVKISDLMNYSSGKVVRGQQMLAPGTTELFGDQMSFDRERIPGGYRN